MPMPKRHDYSEVLEPFFADGWIDEIVGVLKSGKEGTVYCCRAGVQGRDAGRELLAAKVYRPREHRTFRNDAVYQESRGLDFTIAGEQAGKPNKRLQRAFAKKTRVGRAAQYASWMAHEYDTLRLLHRAGASVPEPFAQADHALLMEYFGNDEMPAPLLHHTTLPKDEAPRLFSALLSDIALWLSWGRIHADLSPFNILYWQGKLTVIDFPQAVDPQTNPQARALLGRDIDNVARYFQRFGVRSDPDRLTADLWRRYQRLEL